MTNDPAGVTRYKFPEAAHGQGPQSGDARLQAGGALPFLRAVAVPAGKELVIFSGHTPPVMNVAALPDSVAAFGDTYTQTVGALRELGEMCIRDRIMPVAAAASVLLSSTPIYALWITAPI